MLKKITLFSFFLLLNYFTDAQAVQNAAAIGKGINFSGFEGSSIDLKVLPTYRLHMAVLKNIGIKTIRLPINFTPSFSTAAPVKLINSDNFVLCDSFIQWAKEYNFNLIIDYHSDPATTGALAKDKAHIASIWKNIAKRYAALPTNQFFFELFNEPHDVTTAAWKPVQQEIIDSVRLVAPNHSLLVSGADYGGITGLTDLGLVNDKNIIYSFHFYDPFLFSHQGAGWAGDGVATTGIPYPYNAAAMPPINKLAAASWGQGLYDNYKNDGTDAKILSTIKIASDWSKANNVPIFCGEFGSYGTYADEASRCRHMKAMRTALESFKISYTWWEYLSSFSFFNGNPLYGDIPSCFQDAWGLTNYKALPAPSSFKLMDFDTIPAAFGGDYDNGCSNGYQVVSNPYKNAENSSATVGKFTKCVGAKPWSGMYLGFASTLDIPAKTSKKFCLKVYFEQPGENIYVNIQQGYGAPPLWSGNSGCCIPAKQWKEYCFDLTKNSSDGAAIPAAGSKYSQFILTFDGNTTPTSDRIYYFDDVVLRDVYNTPTSEIKSFDAQISPNPTSDLVNLFLTLPDSENISVNLIDTFGKNVLSQNFSAQGGYSTIPLNTRFLAQGLYILNVSTKASAKTFKLVIQK